MRRHLIEARIANGELLEGGVSKTTTTTPTGQLLENQLLEKGTASGRKGTRQEQVPDTMIVNLELYSDANQRQRKALQRNQVSLVLSCLVLSCLVLVLSWSCLVLSCLGLSCLVLDCLVLS
jgi:hypothetical protein